MKQAIANFDIQEVDGTDSPKRRGRKPKFAFPGVVKDKPAGKKRGPKKGWKKLAAAKEVDAPKKRKYTRRAVAAKAIPQRRRGRHPGMKLYRTITQEFRVEATKGNEAPSLSLVSQEVGEFEIR